jgi:hypothetical protein
MSSKWDIQRIYIKIAVKQYCLDIIRNTIKV